MINIPYEFEGSVSYQKYNDIVDRIKRFPNHKNIGKDESGNYDMYSIVLGDKSKPTLFLGSGMHGTEFHAISYHLNLLESLRDNTYPDPELRNQLLNDFCILSIPVINPYGVDNNNDIYLQFGNNARYNVNGIDLNGDFFNRTQSESRNVINEADQHQVFSALDMHLFQVDYNDKPMIMAGSQRETEKYRNLWADSIRSYTNKELTVWTNPETPNPASGLMRRYFSFRNNIFTPHTLSYITEFVRPTRVGSSIVRPLSDREIFKFGSASLYLFFRTSLQYFEENAIQQEKEKGLVNRIETPTKTVYITRNNEGVATEVLEVYKQQYGGISIKSSIVRLSSGEVDRIIREYV